MINLDLIICEDIKFKLIIYLENIRKYLNILCRWLFPKSIHTHFFIKKEFFSDILFSLYAFYINKYQFYELLDDSLLREFASPL